MYSREKVELFLLATEDGMGPTAAAKFAGVSVGAAKKWATGHLPHSYTGARCEGFFGRLKNEFFHYRDWEGVTAEEFMGRLEAYLVYYREERIKKSLGWLSPMEYRRKLGYA